MNCEGRLLAELPVEPRLGKMVLFSVILKCLDPVVVVVSAMAYKDPCNLEIYLFFCCLFARNYLFK